MTDTPRIHHVQVAMPDGREAEARAFYGDLLGFPEIDKPDTLKSLGGVWFSTGNIDLHVGVEKDFRPQKKAHIAYEVGDLDAVLQRVAKAGYPVQLDDRLPGFRRFYTEDPFGNRIEILTPLA